MTSGIRSMAKLIARAFRLVLAAALAVVPAQPAGFASGLGEVAPAAPASGTGDVLAARDALGEIFDGSRPRSGAADAVPVAVQAPLTAGPAGRMPEAAGLSADGSPGASGVPEVEGVPVPRSSGRRAGTLVLLQIDGLGHAPLREAMERGSAPNLAALLESGGYKAASYRNGMPTVTMAVQTAIFYGKFTPGNEWYSKERGLEQTAEVRETEEPAETGLLHGGRVFLSELSGGAGEGADVRRLFNEDVERHGSFLAVLKELWSGGPLFLRYLLAHNPFVSIPRFLYRLVADAARLRRDFRDRGFDTDLDRKAPFFLSLIANLWSPIAMEGVKRAVRDRAPVVYADLSSYDEEAHYYGASSPEAFEALARIDAMVGELAETAGENEASLVVFSDHGQTPSQGFARLFGETPQQAVDRLLAAGGGEAGPGELVFSHVYPMGNIYARGIKGHVLKEDFEARYPGFLGRLLEHPGVGAAAVRRSGGGFEVLAGDGSTVYDAAGSPVSRAGRDPLSEYADEETTAADLAGQLRDYLALEETGDIVVFAPYRGGSTIDYNTKYTLVSAHGGIGGGQMHPFILFRPGELPIRPAEIHDARDLHRVFLAHRNSLP